MNGADERVYAPPIHFRRQTGRTTRMLTEARRLRDEGRCVYVLVHSEQYKKLLQTQENKGLRFETWYSFRHSYDENTLEMHRAAHANCVLLIDHHALEQKYAAVLRKLRQWSTE